MNSIILFRDHKQGWMAQYLGPIREEVIVLFGTDVLPTAFTSDAPAAAVIREIGRLNPGVHVSNADRA